MTRRVPNEWFSLCTTKSPACPTVPHFALSSTYALPLLFFRSLISFVPPVPTLLPHPSSSCPSYSVIPSLPINLLLLIPRGQTIYTVPSLFSFSPPSPSLSLPPYFNFFPFFVFPLPFFLFFFSFLFVRSRNENTRFARFV